MSGQFVFSRHKPYLSLTYAMIKDICGHLLDPGTSLLGENKGMFQSILWWSSAWAGSASSGTDVEQMWNMR